MMYKSGSSGPDEVPLWGIILCLAVMVFGISNHDLWTPDEPREAEIAREMSAGGSWLVPHLAGESFIEKPPLYYWVSACMMRLFGSWVDLTTIARATSCLASLFTLLLAWWVAKTYLGPRRGRVTLVVLVTMLGFFSASHWVMMDGLLMFFASAAVLLLFVGLDRSRLFLLLGGYLALGLAFLIKGFVSWAVVAPAGLALLWIYYKTILREPLRHLAGILLLVAPGLAWVLALYFYGGPALFHEWFFDNQLGRFMGTTHHLGHINGPFYYLGLAPLVLLPWTPVILGWVAQRGWRQWSEENPHARNLLWLSVAWSFGGLLLLSLAGTKRGIYLYPLLPGFAVVTAVGTDSMQRWVKRLFGFLFVVSLLVMASIAVVTPVWDYQTVTFKFDLKLLVVLFLAASLFTLAHYRQNTLAQVVIFSGLCYLASIFTVIPILNQYKSYVPTIQRIMESIPPSERSRVCGWCLGETERAIFPFYSGMKLNPMCSRERLDDILKGEDEQCSLVVTRKIGLPDQGAELPPWKVLAQKTMEVNRTLMLIRGDGEKEDAR